MSNLNEYTDEQLFKELVNRGLEEYDNEGQAVIYTGIYNLEEAGG